MKELRYSKEPEEPSAFSERFDRTYTRIAGVYDVAVRTLPVWKTWLKAALPHITGSKVLEVSFGTGYLLTRYASSFDVHGVDLNAKMVSIVRKNLRRNGLHANLLRGSALDLPYASGSFDSVVNTMAISGYPNARQAIAEINRVLKLGGRLVLIDINYPLNRNRPGMLLTRCWEYAGDLIRDVDTILVDGGFMYEDIPVGGFGSVHLYVCDKDRS